MDSTCLVCYTEVEANAPTFAHTNADITFQPDTLWKAKQALRAHMADQIAIRPTILALDAPDPPDDVDIPEADMPGVKLACGHAYHIRCLYKFMSKTWNAKHNACMTCNHQICSPHPDPLGMPDGPPPPLHHELTNLNRDATFNPVRESRPLTTANRHVRKNMRELNDSIRDARQARDDQQARYTRQVTQHFGFRGPNEPVAPNSRPLELYNNDGDLGTFGTASQRRVGLERDRSRGRRRGGGGEGGGNGRSFGTTVGCVAITIAASLAR